MKRTRRKLQILRSALLLFATFILVTAAVGFWREKQDVITIQAHFREKEAETRTKIEKLGDGVSLDHFKALFPQATYDKERELWVVSIPVGYSENSACTNVFEQDACFLLDGELVKRDKHRMGGGGCHSDRCNLGGIWYYFWRAWYSSTDYYLKQPDAQK